MAMGGCGEAFFVNLQGRWEGREQKLALMDCGVIYHDAKFKRARRQKGGGEGTLRTGVVRKKEGDARERAKYFIRRTIFKGGPRQKGGGGGNSN